MFWAAVPAQAQTTIVLYSEAGQRPQSYEENGIPKGAYIDNVNRVPKRIPEFKVQDPLRLLGARGGGGQERQQRRGCSASTTGPGSGRT